MAFIQGCQRLGLRLADIRDLLAVLDTGECPCEPAEQLLRRRIAEIDVEMQRTLRAARPDVRHDRRPPVDGLPTATRGDVMVPADR
jgi:DNA-binding transcriptional MerR regulator